MNRWSNRSKALSLAFLFLFLALPVFSQTAGSKTVMTDPVAVFMYCVIGFLFLVVLYMAYLLKIMVNVLRPSDKKVSVLADLVRKLTDTVPVENEMAILTDHEYDGIRELDNNLPPWWIYMFYATIVFAVGYMYYYHISGSRQSQVQEYKEELASAEADIRQYTKLMANSIDETNVKPSDAKGIEKGKSLFLQNCAACHGKLGEGGVGPNLTDNFWLHGGGIKNIFKTIKNGVPQKGMISWKAQLSPLNIQAVSSYILSMKGSNPANPKPPQGNLYQEEK